MNRVARYRAALGSLPAPGGGCHPKLLSVANYGVQAGVPPDQLVADIRQAIPPGTRPIPDREIVEAIQKAVADHQEGRFVPRPRPVPVVEDGAAALQRLLAQAPALDEVDVIERSPVHLGGAPEADAVLFLETLYQPTDLLFIGERHDPGVRGRTIRPVADWIAHYRAGGRTAPHILANPLTGRPALKKTGDGTTLRGDGNVAAYRYCILEFDTLPRAQQLQFWSVIQLPVVALIDSGGKSIHGWLSVAELAEVATAEAWDSQIKGRLYDRLLTPLGVDGACSNPARLSRLPGHYREEKAHWQRLLWLSEKGQALCPTM